MALLFETEHEGNTRQKSETPLGQICCHCGGSRDFKMRHFGNLGPLAKINGGSVDTRLETETSELDLIVAPLLPAEMAKEPCEKTNQNLVWETHISNSLPHLLKHAPHL